MAERTIKLTGDLEAFVDAQVESGAYATPEDVVRAGLEALRGATGAEPDGLSEWERENFAELKKKIDEGMADEKAGRLHYYDNPGDMAADIKREGRRLWQESQESRSPRAARKRSS
ncbi:MAG: type II toxin-antitoxin system ParD family antitoxin [Hyphomicrobiaceae bacterium]